MSYALVVKDDKASEELAQKLRKIINEEYDEINPNKIITVGGDGTFLRAVHQYEHILESVVFYTLNTGHLGYFTNFDVDSIDDLISVFNSNDAKISTFSVLKYNIFTSKETISGIALNEVTIINPTRTLILDVYLNNRLLEHFRGTGICISTPAGSTAYNKSLGGAVIDASLDAFQVTEIASINSRIYHTLSSPLVLSKKHEVEFKAEGDTAIWITADSKSLSIDNFQSLAITLSDHKVHYARHNSNFIERLKKNFI